MKFGVAARQLLDDGGIFAGVRGQLRQLRMKALNPVLQRLRFCEGGQTFIEDGPTVQLQAVLRQIAEGHAAGRLHGTVVQGIKAGEDSQQGRFAGAVAADQAGALSWSDLPVDFFKQEFVAEAFAGAG